MCISTEQEMSGRPLREARALGGTWGGRGCRGPWVRLYILRVKWRLAA